MKKQAFYQPEGIYHVYNHANGKENMFEEEENYRYFLQKYAEKLNGVVTTLAYCLMPNHFHLLIRVKTINELRTFLDEKAKKSNKPLHLPENLSQEELAHFIVKKQFHNFLGGYSKAFNKYTKRKGSLLRQNTRRKIVETEDYLKNAILYLHLNPVYHNFTASHEDWLHSSYQAFISKKKTRIPRTEILDWFGGKEKFIQCHQEKLKSNLDFDLDFEGF